MTLSAGSTTTYAVASALLRVPGLTVVTHPPRVAEVLHESGREDLTVVLTGGERTPSDTLVRVHGMDAETGFATPNLVEAETNRTLVDGARQVAVVADNSKWG